MTFAKAMSETSLGSADPGLQQLFWMDAPDAFSKRVQMAGMSEPPGCQGYHGIA